jgi:hypothetical protein
MKLFGREVSGSALLYSLAGIAEILLGEIYDVSLLIVAGLVTLMMAMEGSIEERLAQLRYRIGELEYKNEQLHRGRGLQNGG